MRSPIALAVLAMFVLGAGCASGYRSGQSSMTGGYASEQEDFNLFSVRYAGNAFVSEQKASDLVLMRAAEVTLEHGFEYLAVIASQNEVNGLGKPSAELLVACFRKDPKHARPSYDVYKASDAFAEMALKYELKRGAEPIQPKRGPFTPAPDSVQFRVAPWYAAEPIAVEDVEYIIRGTSGFDMDGTWVGRYADLENPLATVDDFVEAAKPIAARYGANAIVVEDEPARIHGTARFRDVEESLIGFVADLYMVPTASLGIEWEPGDMLLGKYIIRRFRPGSRCAEAGLKLGDKVLAVNNVDVLETNGLLRQSMRWSVGEKAMLAVVRDGQETVIEVPLVPNILVAR
ncbi:MAG: S1C family serine protease [Sedimentisphaerales bacterium]|nr:S1C family serine protease [Sedimentisphaerales bacterium]HNY80173.1 S1C family serine protease [Sedimentisphaerales bacterium]HOC65531.1 S1C family serine protease [Sedimentisphaerales bacterium]HOH66456.1 S1C family serine protease [Sedimentisphaerales bacterium]HPY50283.1 S1C family serine protease [Sedimentisphaerales bacterium]